MSEHLAGGLAADAKPLGRGALTLAYRSTLYILPALLNTSHIED